MPSCDSTPTILSSVYQKKRKCFIFVYVAVPFGLSSSCRTFYDLMTVLMAFWWRCPIDGHPARASSYIDDVLGVTDRFDSVIIADIYNVTACLRMQLNPVFVATGNETFNFNGI